MMRELLIGTKKGLFVVAGDGEGSFRIATRAFPATSSSTRCATGARDATSPR
jgi:hypothetical protein